MKGAGPRDLARARAASTEPRAPAGPAPAAPSVSYEDRVAFEQAFAGVRRLDQPSPGDKRLRAQRVAGPVATPDAADAGARARLDALVSGGIRFEVHREEGWVEGARQGADPRALRALQNGRAVADAAVDLHGLRRDEAIGALRTALRQARGRGHRVVRIIHGKGQHSAGGVGVLGDAVVDAIVDGPLGSLVLAFVTTSLEHGGSGALLAFVAPG